MSPRRWRNLRIGMAWAGLLIPSPWLDPASNVLPSQIRQELLATEGLSEPAERFKFVNLVLLDLDSLAGQPAAIDKIFPRLLTLFRTLSELSPAPDCLLGDFQIRRMLLVAEHSQSDRLTSFLFTLLEENARCRNESLLCSIESAFPSEVDCGRQMHAEADLKPTNDSTGTVLDLEPCDLPFFPLRRNPRILFAACEGIDKFAIFFKRNFVFRSELSPKPTFETLQSLFTYDRLKDRSGEKLRALGFQQDGEGRFIIPAYSNLRELTADHPDLVFLLEQLYLEWYVPPDGDFIDRWVFGPVKRAFLATRSSETNRVREKGSETFVPLPSGKESSPGERAEAERMFEKARAVALKNGVAEVYVAIQNHGHHSLLVRASQCWDVLLVVDASLTYPNTYTHLWRFQDRFYLEGLNRPGYVKRYGGSDDPEVRIFWVRTPESNVFYELPD